MATVISQPSAEPLIEEGQSCDGHSVYANLQGRPKTWSVERNVIPRDRF